MISAKSREKRWMALKGNEPLALHTYQQDKESRVGNIYRGRVQKVEKGLGAAFIDFGDNKNGYLHEKDTPQNSLASLEKRRMVPIQQCVHEGQWMFVQVTKDASEHKGARLTAVLEFTTDAFVYMPQGQYVTVSRKIENKEVHSRLVKAVERWRTAEEGVIVRTNAAEHSTEKLVEELSAVREDYQQLLSSFSSVKSTTLVYERNDFQADLFHFLMKHHPSEILIDDFDWLTKIKAVMNQKGLQEHCQITLYQGKEEIFTSFGVHQYWEKALKRIVWLENGASIVIEATEALTVIDVNSGKFTGKASLTQTSANTNIAAAKQIAKELILRNISGIILIDFIDMRRKKDQEAVIITLEKGLAKDQNRSVIVGFTELGILQLTRKKTRPSLSDYLTINCPTCQGKGRVLSSESVAFQLERELWELEDAEGEEIIIQCSQDVWTTFVGEGEKHLDRMQGKLGKKIQAEIQLAPPFYTIKRIQ